MASTFGPRVPWLAGLPEGITDWTPDNDRWELYNLDEDWSQASDLAAEMPEKLAQTREMFAIEAARNSVLPIGGGLWVPVFHPELRITPPYREWDFPGLVPVPTPETKRPTLSSIYALTKYDQERACLVAGAAYGIPTVALRLFNVYGPGQALSNPYTGVLAIFAARLLNDRAPRVFEDGEQRRDFVSVHDVARAFALALERDGADGLAVNVGSGASITVNALAELLARTLGKDVAPEVTGEFRFGDIRHCLADVSLAREALGFEPQVTLEAGIAELAEWLAGQTAVDRVDEATAELARRGLTG